MFTTDQMFALYEDLKLGRTDQVAQRVVNDGRRSDAAQLAAALAAEVSISAAVNFCQALKRFEDEKLADTKDKISACLHRICEGE